MAEPIISTLGIVGIKNCGAYDNSTNYEKLNVVTYEGSSYCAKGNTVGHLPTDTDYWDLLAQKGDKGDTGDTGPQGPKPVKGVDYYTADDIADLESTLSSDVTTEVSSQLSTLTSATPLAASSIADMTDTTRIYVNTTDGHWYWYDGDSWEDGGVYQNTGLNEDVFKIPVSLTDGFIGYDGAVTDATADEQKITSYIKVISGGKINFQLSFASTQNMWVAVGYYNGASFISRSILKNGNDTSYSGSITIPSNCDNIRFCFSTFGVEYSYLITDITNYNTEYNTLNVTKDIKHLKQQLLSKTIYQYLDSSKWIANSLWHNSGSYQGNNVAIASVNGFRRYPTIHLPAGTYSITTFYAIDSYIKYDDGTLVKFSDAFPYIVTRNSYPKTFTTTQGFEFYISCKDADSDYSKIMLVDDTSIPVNYKDIGEYYVKLNTDAYIGNHTLKQVDEIILSEFDYTKYKYAYIHNGALIGNSNKGAKYTQVDMGSLCKKMMCRYKLHKNNDMGNTGCVTLITVVDRKNDDGEPVNDIGRGSVHVTFTPINTNVSLFIDHQLINIGLYSYTELDADDETEYECGIEFLGDNTLKVYLPDGTTKTLIDSRIDDLNGRYVIWEHYTTNYSTAEFSEITEDMSQPVMTGFYCRCENNVELRDNFQREDGHIGTAPTGQTYRVFANRGSSYTIYDDV